MDGPQTGGIAEADAAAIARDVAWVRRWRLPRPAGYLLVAAIIGMALVGSAVPSPLYAIYQAEWGFSSFSLTLVFALYAIGVLAALVLVGRISDDIGRRPVLMVGLAGLLGSTALFLVAGGLPWLLLARTLQGIATGVCMGAAGAALIELHAQRDGYRAGFLSGLMATTGMGFGALGAALLVDLAPRPTTLSFALLLGVYAVLLVGVTLMPEPLAAPTRPSRFRPQWPHVPAQIRGVFVLSSLGVLATWSVGGLYLSVGPGLAALLASTGDALPGGVAAAALALSGAAAQVACHRRSTLQLTVGGAVAVATGMLLMVGSLSWHSTAAFLAASSVAGVGFGTAFLGSLRSLMGAVPEERSAEVLSAFYVVAYGSISVPVLAAGISLQALSIETTFRVFGVVVAALALVVAGASLRVSRRQAPGT